MAEKRKVMLVEDEPHMVELLRFRLEANNYDVVVATDGQEALDKVGPESPDLIILDVMLPKVNGYKVCRLLKFDERYRRIPVIILTARIRPEDRETALQAGADEYMVKPFESQELLSKIEALLARQTAEEGG